MSNGTCASNIAKQLGCSVSELYEMLGNDSASLHVYSLSENGLAEFRNELRKLNDYEDLIHQACTASERSQLNVEKGRAFEKLIQILLRDMPVYSVACNRRTSTHEIDMVLLKKTNYAYLSDEIYQNRILCECKNYQNRIPATFVGKFATLMRVSNCKTGVMFSPHGLTGKTKWNDGNGLCRKIALADKAFIVPIDMQDINDIAQRNIPLWEIVRLKQEKLCLDIKLDLEQHELCTDSLFVST